jgi:hypothetical protein
MISYINKTFNIVSPTDTTCNKSKHNASGTSSRTHTNKQTQNENSHQRQHHKLAHKSHFVLKEEEHKEEENINPFLPTVSPLMIQRKSIEKGSVGWEDLVASMPLRKL